MWYLFRSGLNGNGRGVDMADICYCRMLHYGINRVNVGIVIGGRSKEEVSLGRLREKTRRLDGVRCVRQVQCGGEAYCRDSGDCLSFLDGVENRCFRVGLIDGTGRRLDRRAWKSSGYVMED